MLSANLKYLYKMYILIHIVFTNIFYVYLYICGFGYSYLPPKNRRWATPDFYFRFAQKLFYN
jgi:hypothetical protein